MCADDDYRDVDGDGGADRRLVEPVRIVAMKVAKARPIVAARITHVARTRIVTCVPQTSCVHRRLCNRRLVYGTHRMYRLTIERICDSSEDESQCEGDASDESRR